MYTSKRNPKAMKKPRGWLGLWSWSGRRGLGGAYWSEWTDVILKASPNHSYRLISAIQNFFKKFCFSRVRCSMMNKAIQNPYKIEYNTKFQNIITIRVMINSISVHEAKPNHIIEYLKEFIERLTYTSLKYH